MKKDNKYRYEDDVDESFCTPEGSGFKLREMINYCREKGIDSEDLTDEELEMFKEAK